jgi:hypothetical protein
MFLGIQDQDPDPLVREVRIRIRILLSSNKNSKKPSIYTVLWLLYDFLFLKTDENVALKIKKQKKNFFVDILKAADEMCWFRIRKV